MLTGKNKQPNTSFSLRILSGQFKLSLILLSFTVLNKHKSGAQMRSEIQRGLLDSPSELMNSAERRVHSEGIRWGDISEHQATLSSSHSGDFLLGLSLF